MLRKEYDMKDGYYLSTFLVNGELPCALDIKLRHDQTIALWEKKGDSIDLIRYWELERISGWKQHTFTFFSREDLYNVMDYLLASVGIKREELIEIWGTPSIDTCNDYIDENTYNGIGYHNICHLFSAYLCEENKDNEDYLIFALDSGPDSVGQFDAYHKIYYAGAYCHNGKIDIFPVQSPGKLWSSSKKKFGLREGTLMALASACEARVLSDYDCDIDLSNEYALENALFFLDGLTKHIAHVGFSIDERFSREENYISAFMKQINKKTQQIVSNNVSVAIEKYGIRCEETVLGLAGGFTLNCPTNTYLMDKFRFKKMQIPPCANDSGEAFGIGLLSFFHKMNKVPSFSLRNAFMGADINDFVGDTTDDAIMSYSDEIVSIEEFDLNQVALDIRDNIVVWLQGRSEIGPRALGHRSILGNPQSAKIKDRLNNIKGRQWWRPVAPIVLQDYSEEIFVQKRISPYMLEAFTVKKEWKDKIPAVVHLDGTARVQTLSKSDNELLYSAIQAFNNITGIPVVCNTSLNDKGEPIIQTVGQAIDFCLEKGITLLYVNGKRFLLKKYDKAVGYARKTYERNPNLFSHLDEKDILFLNEKYNPFGLNKDVLTFYYDNPDILEKYDIRILEDCEEVIKLTNIFMEKNGISLKRDIL